MNLARLNHILIPQSKERRDRLRRSWIARVLRPLGVWRYFSTEGRMLILLWLMAGATGLNVRLTQTYLVWCLLTGLLLGSLVLRRWFALADVQLTARAPRRVMVDEDALFTLALANSGARDHHAIRVTGPFLPWDGAYRGRPPAIRELAAGATVEVSTAIRFRERGEHHLDPFRANALVPLGLAVGPDISSAGARFLVVPRIAAVKRLQLPLGQRYQPGGVALASRTGESMELLGVRPYRPGDPIRDLHARRWARVGQPVVREYQQEYFTRVGVVLDTDLRQSSAQALEAAISLAAGVVAHLSRGEALIDLLVVGDQVHQLTLGRSLGFLEQALDLLACVKSGRALDPARLEARLLPHLPRLSCVVLVALAWDAPRQQLAGLIRDHGAGCRVLQVAEATATATPGVTLLTPAAVAGEGLVL